MQLVSSFVASHAGEDGQDHTRGEVVMQKLVTHLRRIRAVYTKANPDAKQGGGRPREGAGYPKYEEMVGLIALLEPAQGAAVPELATMAGPAVDTDV